MTFLKNVKIFFEEKSQYWYYILSLFSILFILNYAFLSYVVPFWIPHFISIILIILLTAYVSIIYKNALNSNKQILESEKESLYQKIKLLETEFTNRLDTQRQINKKISDDLHLNIDKTREKVIQELSLKTTNGITELIAKISSSESVLKVQMKNEFEKLYNFTNNMFETHQKTLEQSRDLLEKKISDSTQYLNTNMELFHAENNANFNTSFENIQTAKESILELNKSNKLDIDNSLEKQYNTVLTTKNEIKDMITQHDEHLSILAENIRNKVEESHSHLYNILGDNYNHTLEKLQSLHDESLQTSSAFENKIAQDISFLSNNVQNNFISEANHIFQAKDELNQAINLTYENSKQELQNTKEDLLKELSNTFVSLSNNLIIKTTDLEKSGAVNTTKVIDLFKEQSDWNKNKNKELHLYLNSIEQLILNNTNENIQLTTSGIEKIISSVTENQKLLETTSHERHHQINSIMKNYYTDSKNDILSLKKKLSSELVNITLSMDSKSASLNTTISEHNQKLEKQFKQSNELANSNLIKIVSQIAEAKTTMNQNHSETNDIIKTLLNNTIDNLSTQFNEGILALDKQITHQNEAIKNTLLDKIHNNQNITLSSTEMIEQSISSSTNNLITLLNSLSSDTHSFRDFYAKENKKLFEAEAEDIANLKESLHYLTAQIESGNEARLTLSNDLKNMLSSSSKKTIDATQSVQSGIIDFLTIRLNKAENGITTSVQNVENSLNSIIKLVDSAKEATLNLSHSNHKSILDKINKTQDSSNNILETINRRYTAFDNSINTLKNMISENIINIQNKTTETQNVVVKLLNQCLDETDNVLEKSDRAYDRIIKQVHSFATDTKKQLSTLKEELTLQAKTIEKSFKNSSQDFSAQNLELKNDLNKATHSWIKQNDNLTTKIENLENQLLNLQKLADIIKGLSAGKQPDSKVKNPNRIEEIKDADSNITVYNHFKNDVLIFTEMKTGNKKSYDVEYDTQGRMTKSRNYNTKGELTTELTYHDNGEVKSRVETILKDGKLQKETTYFDKQGKKIK